MRWWQLKKRDADLERELRSDLELEEEEQRENGLSGEEARYAARRVGQLVSIPGYRGDSSWLQIVGEVRDVKVHDLREAATPMLYLPMFQAPEGGATFEIRTSMDSAYAETAVLSAVKPSVAACRSSRSRRLLINSRILWWKSAWWLLFRALLGSWRCC